MTTAPRGSLATLAALAVATSTVVLASAPPPATASGHSSSRPSTFSAAVYTEQVGALGAIGGVTVRGDGFGSAVAAVPGHPDQVYGLTDRGPNVDGPDGTKIEPYPDFTPAIGRFRLRHGKARLLQTIRLQAADGTPYNGRVNSQANTGETITDLDGRVLPASPQGYDSEGLVARPDGTFWVSDEYGPFITHFDRHGRALERLSPDDGTLPRELARRTPNRGMEGLTITPDGRTLVGIMQSALTQPDQKTKATKVSVTRIVTIDLHTRISHEYAYVLDDPADNGTAVSEIAALSATTFLVDERDSDFGPGAYKKLWKIDISRASDIGPRATIGSYQAGKGGLLIGGETLEAIAGSTDRAKATTALADAGVEAVSVAPYLDLGALVSGIDPNGTFFNHDKIEGVAVLDHGRKIIISNDSDFGLANSTGNTPPFGLVAKTRPDGEPDTGEFLVINRR